MQFCGILEGRGLNRGGMDIIKFKSPINSVACCSPYKQQSGVANDNSITNKIITFCLFPVLFYKLQQ